ncbi:MAG: hypothetical protein U9R26_10045 [Campylobacterota bacterium]|nr:hypothetical protein [Campylobacterota bacterium]
MQKLVITLIGLLFFTHNVWAENRLCYSYDPDRFIAWSNWVPPGTDHNASAEMKPIKEVYIDIPESIEGQDKVITFFVVIDQRTYMHDEILCYERTPQFYKCGGVCDSGQLKLNSSIDVMLDRLDFNYHNGEEPVTELELEQRNPKKWIKAKPIPCPKKAQEEDRRREHSLVQ